MSISGNPIQNHERNAGIAEKYIMQMGVYLSHQLRRLLSGRLSGEFPVTNGAESVLTGPVGSGKLGHSICW
jgi:hypothetical protein